jgi:cytochrome c-type biogenesis protein CcmF
VASVQFIGEQLGWQQAGYAFAFLSFAAALLASLSYFFSAQNNELEDGPWRKLGRISFRLHSVAVIGIMAVLFMMILKHMYQYAYVWEHSDDSMPKRYTLASFWADQEGSFLLWTFWQVVLGNILIYTAKKWESPVMATISLVQAFLASMLVGFYVFGVKIGSSPFVLLRDAPGYENIPLFAMADYVTKLAPTARGLNPLLQNYWMTIHPPTLFLGFASTVVPFAYAVAGLWKRKYGEWQLEALPWTFFGIMILGTGILMGGAWAYESLSFGGFWAWDPVENASLFPWLTLVGAGHIMIIYKARKQSLFSTFFFCLITFLLVLYSTFLTRSGILGSTSVHSFATNGMDGQLFFYLMFFVILAIGLLIIHKRKMPKELKEEELWSREFWMFLGALVLLMSCLQIIITTSIPVNDKVFGYLSRVLPFGHETLQKLSKIAAPNEPKAYYNRWQVPFATIILIMVGFGLYLKFKATDIKQFWKMLRTPLIVSLILGAVCAILLKERNGFYIALLIASWFAVIANLNYWITAKKANIQKAGASFAHVGFGLIMMGALISTSMEQIISQNSSGKSVEGIDKSLSNATDILLQQGDTLKMGNYYVTYSGKKKVGHDVRFKIEYYERDTTAHKYIYKFTLTPVVQLNSQMGNVLVPSTHHFLTKDIYTHITFGNPNIEKSDDKGDEYTEAKMQMMKVGDTTFSSNSIIILTGLDTHIDKEKYHLQANDIAVGAVLKVIDVNDKNYTVEPVYVIHDNMEQAIDGDLKGLGLKFSFTKVDPDTHKVQIAISESKRLAKDFVVMEAFIFPYINILWIGCLIMVFGTVLSIRQRIRKNREARAQSGAETTPS